MMRALPALCAAAGLLAGCSMFEDKPAALKPAELAAIQPSAELQVLWQAQVGAAGDAVLVPAVVGTSVFAAARDGTLARFDGGREVWRIAAGKPLSGGVGSDGQLVVVGTAKGEVLTFHAADGRPAWQARAGSEILAAPALQGDLVVVRSGDARIYGFAAADGKRRWTYQRSTPPLALRAPVGVALTSKAIYAGFPGGKLAAIALGNGAALWEATVALPRGATELERIADVASEPVVDGGSVCAAAYQGRVACFDAETGRQLWARDLSSAQGLDSGGRALYVTDEKGVVHALDRASGAPLWKQDQLLLRGVTRPLAVGSRVAVADFEGVVHLLSGADGAFVARYASGGMAVVAPPRRLADGFVVQTRGGALHALTVR